MARHGNWRRWVGTGVAAALVGGAVGACNNGKPGVAVTSKDDGAPTVNIPGDPGAANTVAADPKLHMSFEEACTNEIPVNSPLALPPDLTLTGKQCGLLNDAVVKLWDQIKFVSADGKRQTYVAELEVFGGNESLGTIEMLMQPDVAPNHVRNFVALATLEYYDGLRFDRIVKQKGEDDKGQASLLTLLEAGSPVDPPDASRSHLAYWVKPEFNEGVKHEEGSVGACLLESEDNAETAAVRFYINLTPAPAMDGNYTIFAKVTKGIEVARRIAEQPVQSSEPGPDQGRPAAPIVIKKVTVRAVPVQ